MISSKEIEAEREELANTLVQYVENCNKELERDMTLHVKEPKDWFLLHVLFSLYNLSIEQTKAIALCVTKGYATAARTCLRGLVELTLDVRLILDYGNPHENAIRFLALSTLELKKTLQKGNVIDGESQTSIESNLNDYRKVFPDTVKEIEDNFSAKRIMHWSGLSYRDRLSNIKGASFEGLDLVYGVLSWDTHGRMVAHRTKFEISGNKLSIKSEGEDDNDLETFVEITDNTGRIFNSISSAIFSAPIISEKTTK